MKIELQNEEQEFKPVVLRMVIESEDELAFWKALCALPIDEILNITVAEVIGIDPEIARDCIEPLRETFIANDVVKPEVVQNRLKEAIESNTPVPCSCVGPHDVLNTYCVGYDPESHKARLRSVSKIPASFQCICGARSELQHTSLCVYANKHKELGDDHAHSA